MSESGNKREEGLSMHDNFIAAICRTMFYFFLHLAVEARGIAHKNGTAGRASTLIPQPHLSIRIPHDMHIHGSSLPTELDADEREHLYIYVYQERNFLGIYSGPASLSTKPMLCKILFFSINFAR